MAKKKKDEEWIWGIPMLRRLRASRQKYYYGGGGGGSGSTPTPPSTFDAQYQAVLDRGTALGYTLPSAAQQIIENNIVLSLKSGGIWTELDVFYFFATDGDQNYATLNWKSPASFQCTRSGGITHTSLSGYTGDGTSGYLNTNFAPRTNGVKYTTNNAGLGGKYITMTDRSQVLFGVDTAAGDDTILLQQAVGTNNFFRINYDGVGSGTAVSGATDFYVHLRRPDASNEFCQFVNTESTRAVASSNVPTRSIKIMAMDTSTVISLWSTGTVKYFFVGSNTAAVGMKAIMDVYA